MNQILISKDSSFNINNKLNQKKSKKFFFWIQFFVCIIIVVCMVFYYIYYQYDKNKNEKLSKQIVDNFNITKLYENNPNHYEANLLSVQQDYQKDDTNFSVIGLIEINSINLHYPIISTFDMQLLKIAPCKFFGPNPNQVGNLCIAGHNYNSYKFFSRLKELNIGDIISIYDLSGKKINYSVYSSYETEYNDLDCMNQNTNGQKELTLVTCNNIKNKRRIIKATQKG